MDWIERQLSLACPCVHVWIVGRFQHHMLNGVMVDFGCISSVDWVESSRKRKTSAEIRGDEFAYRALNSARNSCLVLLLIREIVLISQINGSTHFAPL